MSSSNAPAGPATAVTVAGNPPTKTTTAITALAALPVLRQATLRAGKQFAAGRSSKEEAYLGQERGTVLVRASACSHCRQSYGVFTDCVVVTGLLGHSCTNCYYNGDGPRCSLRQG